MKYQIEVSYETGDSFHTENTSDFLEETWTDLTIAKENLKRIKEHYEYYEYKQFLNRFRKNNEPEMKKPDCVVESHGEVSSIILLLDNGKEWQFWPQWIGYFESLQGAEIIPDESDMKFEIGY